MAEDSYGDFMVLDFSKPLVERTAEVMRRIPTLPPLQPLDNYRPSSLVHHRQCPSYDPNHLASEVLLEHDLDAGLISLERFLQMYPGYDHFYEDLPHFDTTSLAEISQLIKKENRQLVQELDVDVDDDDQVLVTLYETTSNYVQLEATSSKAKAIPMFAVDEPYKIVYFEVVENMSSEKRQQFKQMLLANQSKCICIPVLCRRECCSQQQPRTTCPPPAPPPVLPPPPPSSSTPPTVPLAIAQSIGRTILKKMLFFRSCFQPNTSEVIEMTPTTGVGRPEAIQSTKLSKTNHQATLGRLEQSKWTNNEHTNLTIMLPNGFYATVRVLNTIKLADLKHELVIKLQQMNQENKDKNTKQAQNETIFTTLKRKISSSEEISKSSRNEVSPPTRFQRFIKRFRRSPSRVESFELISLNSPPPTNINDNVSRLDALLKDGNNASEAFLSLEALSQENIHNYNFAGVSVLSEVLEMFDDELQLAHLNLFYPLLKLIEVSGNKIERTLNNAIGAVLEHPLTDLDAIQDPEFCHYRANLHQHMLEVVQYRESQSTEEKLIYKCSPAFDDLELISLSSNVARKMSKELATSNMSLASFDSFEAAAVGLADVDDRFRDQLGLGVYLSAQSVIKDEEEIAQKTSKTKVIECNIYSEILTLSIEANGSKFAKAKAPADIEAGATSLEPSLPMKKISNYANMGKRKELRQKNEQEMIKDMNSNTKLKRARFELFNKTATEPSQPEQSSETEDIVDEQLSSPLLDDTEQQNEPAAAGAKTLRLWVWASYNTLLGKPVADCVDLEATEGIYDELFGEACDDRLVYYTDTGFKFDSTLAIPENLERPANPGRPKPWRDDGLYKYEVVVHGGYTQSLVIAQLLRILLSVCAHKSPTSMMELTQNATIEVDERRVDTDGAWRSITSNVFIDTDDYVLKIVGLDQYLVGNYRLSTYEYIRQCLIYDKLPKLMLIAKKDLLAQVSAYHYVVPSFLRSAEKRFPTTSMIYKYRQMLGTRSGFVFNLNRIGPHNYLEDVRDRAARGPTDVNGELGDGSPESTKLVSILKKPKRSSKRVRFADEQHLTNYWIKFTHDIDFRTTFNTGVAVEELSKAIAQRNQAPNFSSHDPFNVRAERLINKRSYMSTWNLDRELRVRIIAATSLMLNTKELKQIFIEIGLHHCHQILFAPIITDRKPITGPRWRDFINFDNLNMCDLPLNTIMSFKLFGVAKSFGSGCYKAPNDKAILIAWGNVPLFDHQREMLNGRYRILLNMAPNDKTKPTEASFDCSLPIFWDESLHGPSLSVDINGYFDVMMYPPTSHLRSLARVANFEERRYRRALKKFYQKNMMATNFVVDPKEDKEDANYINVNNLKQVTAVKITNFLCDELGEDYQNCLSFFGRAGLARYHRSETQAWVLRQLTELCSRQDPYQRLTAAEKVLIWRERYLLRQAFPNALPKLIEAVDWSNRVEMCQFYHMLEHWPAVTSDVGIILLGSRYADHRVRAFAIWSLDESMTDDLLRPCLLELIQVLKSEPHLDSYLARFLLRRALLNRRFGQTLFWQARAQLEMAPAHRNRFSVLLEMLCRGMHQSNLSALVRQVRALTLMQEINAQAVGADKNSKNNVLAIFERLREANRLKELEQFASPMNPDEVFEKIRADKCKLMDSAKRPVWLEWSNPDRLAGFDRLDRTAIIFKAGDDLRQDMLTLQMFHLIQMIWRRHQLDLRMLPYNALATGDMLGVIEVVRSSNTVMGILRAGGLWSELQWDTNSLHEYIQRRNLDNYEQAIDNFTKSLAGYCVATFVLGIGDRHPDNIMVRDDGILFHIDFGHILGNFKSKFGINRERVPFVLTYDFLKVITKGSSEPLKCVEFASFRDLCTKAYLVLHENANVIISMFLMMLNVGMPELQTSSDVNFLRETLQVGRNREVAAEYFETQLNIAHSGAWATKIDWFFHSIKHR